MSMRGYRFWKRRADPAWIRERRAVIRQSLAVAAACLLSERSGLPRTAAAGRRIAVVGAGLGGLACAYELSHLGYDLQVIEARGRVGGRVLSLGQWLGRHTLEGGGELIGSQHATWWAYRERFHLDFDELTDEPSRESPVVLGGRALATAEVDEAYREIENALSGCNRLAQAVDAERPWLSPEATELDRRSLADWLSTLVLSPVARQILSIQLSSDNAVPNHQASLLGMLAAVRGGGLQDYWDHSEDFRCRGGNQQLAVRLAEALGRGRVHLERPVLSIDYGGDEVEVVSADQQRLVCDEVVLAIPPSLWSKIAFRPALPLGLRPQFGMALKYLAGVANHGWDSQRWSGRALSDGLICETWDASAMQAAAGEHRVIVGFSGGGPARQGSRLPPASRESTFRGCLEQCFPGLTPQLLRSQTMDWPSDPWTGGGYSFPAPGQVTRQGPSWHEGLGKLHFCGEHTHYAFVGFMEGALKSGVELARRLAIRDGLIDG
jgi:monoamine oxidase